MLAALALNTRSPGRRASSSPSAPFGRCDVKSPARRLGGARFAGELRGYRAELRMVPVKVSLGSCSWPKQLMVRVPPFHSASLGKAPVTQISDDW